jgi:hypothetical protein
MKFDYVIGNPPYQDSSHTEKKNTLWRKFLDLSLKLSKEETGIISFVIPSSWMGSKKLLDSIFLNNNLLYVNKDECKRHFPRVGSTFSYFVMQTSSYKGETKFKNKEINGTVVDSLSNINDVLVDVFPRNLSNDSISLINKVLNSNKNLLGVINNTTHHCVHKDRWSLTQDTKFQYPIHNTPTKLYWWITPHKHSGLRKVVIPTTTYYRNMFYTINGVTQSFCYYLLKETENEDIVLHNINNIVFDYINECFRYANWNSVPLLRKLPELPFDKKMNDNEIFEYFGLTDNEVKVIKDTIKWR